MHNNITHYKQGREARTVRSNWRSWRESEHFMCPHHKHTPCASKPFRVFQPSAVCMTKEGLALWSWRDPSWTPPWGDGVLPIPEGLKGGGTDGRTELNPQASKLSADTTALRLIIYHFEDDKFRNMWHILHQNENIYFPIAIFLIIIF